METKNCEIIRQYQHLFIFKYAINGTQWIIIV